MWSLGVVVYEALTGCQPFLADGAEEMAEVQRQRLAERDERGLPRLITERPGLSLEAQSFLAEALQLDPINRASAERLLKHPLLQVRGTRMTRFLDGARVAESVLICRWKRRKGRLLHGHLKGVVQHAATRSAIQRLNGPLVLHLPRSATGRGTR